MLYGMGNGMGWEGNYLLSVIEGIDDIVWQAG